MITISQLEQKAKSVASAIGVETHHLLTILHNDLNKLLGRVKSDATLVPHVLARVDEAKAAIVSSVNEVHADVTAEVAKVDVAEDKVVAVVKKVKGDIKGGF